MAIESLLHFRTEVSFLPLLSSRVRVNLPAPPHAISTPPTAAALRVTATEKRSGCATVLPGDRLGSFTRLVVFVTIYDNQSRRDCQANRAFFHKSIWQYAQGGLNTCALGARLITNYTR